VNSVKIFLLTLLWQIVSIAFDRALPLLTKA